MSKNKKNKYVNFSMGALLAILMIGCANKPNSSETVIAKADYYVRYQLFNPEKKFTDISFKNSSASMGDYKEEGDYYWSSMRIKNYYALQDIKTRKSAEFLREKFVDSFEYVCAQMNGRISKLKNYPTRAYCRSGDEPSDVKFFVDISNISEKSFFGMSGPMLSSDLFEIAVYARKKDNAPIFDKFVVDYLGYQSDASIKLKGYRADYTSMSAQTNLKLKYELHQSFLTYGDYDPDGVMPIVKKYVAENAAGYEAIKRELAEQKRRDTEQKDRQQEAIQKAAREERVKELAAMKKVGAVICKMGSGYREVFTGFIVSNIRQTRKEDFEYMMRGVVEAFAENKIQVRISSIYSTPGGYMDVIRGDNNYSVNQISWGDVRDWHPC